MAHLRSLPLDHHYFLKSHRQHKHLKLSTTVYHQIITIFSSLIDNTNINPTRSPNYNIDAIKRDIKDIHKHFVVVPIDKASNNYSIICKKAYIQFLDTEMNINNSNSTISTYIRHNLQDKDQIIQNHNIFSQKFLRQMT